MAQKILDRAETASEQAAPPQSDPADYEKWLYENPEALADVKRGLADSAAGRGVAMSFLEYADSDVDE